MQSATDLDIFSSYDGCRLATRNFGQSGIFNFVLLHGAGRTLADWGQIGPQLSRYGRVIAIDLRGHGHSGDGPWTLEAIFSDLDDVLGFYGASKVIVVGHSLGGVIATLYSSKRTRVIATVNLDGYCLEPEKYDGLNSEQVKSCWSRFRSEHPWHVSPKDLASIEAQVSCWSEKYKLAPSLAAEIVSRALKPFSDGLFIQVDSQTASDGAQWLYMGYFWDHSFFDLISVMRKPYLLIQSSHVDASGLPAWQSELLNALRNGIDMQISALLDLPDVDIIRFDADHFLHLSHGTEAVNAIISFLDCHL